MIVVAVIAIIASIAVPSLFAARLRANEETTIATLRSIASIQTQCQASGEIDVNGNGAGEFGYFGELAGRTGLRNAAGSPGSKRLDPPFLTGAFANVSTRTGITGGIVSRSGYYFQVYLPDAGANGVPEADHGGVGSSPPDSRMAEVFWCCYAWPAAYGKSGQRAFFVNQVGDVLATKNFRERYNGGAKVPAFDAAFLKGSGNAMGSTIAANASGTDDQMWFLVH